MNTESQNPRTEFLSEMSVEEILLAMSYEDEVAASAVRSASGQIALAANAVATCFTGGLTTLFVGAGTSGRLAMMEAAEMVPTFSVEPQQFVALKAGDRSDCHDCPPEDDVLQAEEDFCSVANVGCVVGISASGQAPYVLEVIRLAANVTTIGIANNPDAPLLSSSRIPVLLDTGAEVLTGSTRLKAGTAQKMALNQITTAAMVLCGRVSGNMMTFMIPVNSKLRKRAIGIVMSKMGVTRDDALSRLDAAQWSLPKALGYIP